jgi:preprotein translocase subunit SecB
MGDSGIESAFKFVAFKVHDLRLSMKPPVDIARPVGPEDVWQLKIGVRVPQYLAVRKVYIAGLNLQLALFSPELLKDQPELANDDAILFVEASCSGAFSVAEGQFSREIEDKLVKIQAPALLLPYVRATILSLLANAGFGSAMLPLINMNELAKMALEGTEIEIIDA